MSNNDSVFPRAMDMDLGDQGSDGIILRDYFAAKAMSGALAGHHAHAGHEDYWPPHGVAAYAYEIADAMLKAREVKP